TGTLTRLSRRTMLAGLAGGSAAALVGTTRAASGSYDVVVDLVDEGADPDGNESIVPLLNELAADDTRIDLPSGEYLMTEQFRFTDYRNLAIVGDDATIVPGTVEEMEGRTATAGTFGGPTRLFRLGVSYAPGDELRFEGLTFDFTADNSGFRAIEAYVKRDMLVRDVDVTGRHDLASFGPALFSVTDPDGISTVEGFRAPDGGVNAVDAIGGDPNGPTGILVPQSHEGKLWLRDCELGGFPDNGVYASCPNGRVVVKGGTFKNSDVSNVRLYGDYSYLKDATVVVDESHDGFDNQRGVRLDQGKHLWVYDTTIRLDEPNGDAITVMGGVDSARIQQSEITVGDAVNDAIVVEPGAGRTDIYHTDVEMTTGGQAIQIEPASDGGGIVDCLYVTITGDASGSPGGRHAIRCERDGCLFRHLVVKQPGPNFRRGLQVSGRDCYVYSGYYGTSHIPIVNDGDDTLIEDVTARSLDGYEALKLLDHTSDVDVVSNKLYNGVWDKGSDDLYMTDNEFPSG
ncbi:MAG: right-handed parallel beta-helix repeat-containing protein, partial [Haloarculaceae archaeon]